MDLDDEELKATRLLNGSDKKCGMFKKKTVIEHIDSLIEFYSKVETSDERLKKLIVRNLKDVKRRAEKE